MSQPSDQTPRTRAAWNFLTLILAAETIGLAVVAVLQLQNMFRVGATDPNMIALDVSVFVMLLIVALWLAAALVGSVRTKASWVRGSAVTMHVLLFAAGTGILQGIIGTQELGWALVVLAFVGFITALFAHPIREETPGYPEDHSAE